MAKNNDYFIENAKNLSNELAPAIGEFVLGFERLCHLLRMGVEHILSRRGLTNPKLAEIIVGDMTLFPLQNVYRSLMVEAFNPDNKDLAIIDNIFKNICSIGEERNGIIHSAWFIDFRNSDDINNGLLMRYRPGASKRGAKESPIKYPLREIKQLTTTTRTITNLIEELNMCVYRNVPITSRFVIDDRGNVRALGSILDHFQRKTSKNNVSDTA